MFPALDQRKISGFAKREQRELLKTSTVENLVLIQSDRSYRKRGTICIGYVKQVILKNLLYRLCKTADTKIINLYRFIAKEPTQKKLYRFQQYNRHKNSLFCIGF
jgi:hypothetical protein